MDWFVALAPLLALILILVFGFTGCSVDREGLASPVQVDTLFFPTDDPAAPTQFVLVRLTPWDTPDFDSGDFPPSPEDPVTGPDGSRSQRIGFAYIDGHMATVTCSVSLIPEPASIRVPPIPEHQKAVVRFTASRGATSWDLPTLMLVDL